MTLFNNEAEEIDIELLNFTNYDIGLKVVVSEDNETIMDETYDINGRSSSQRSIPNIKVEGFTEATNGDEFDVHVEIVGTNREETGVFRINCIGEKDTRSVFFIEIRQRGESKYIEFNQSTC
ncbi:hypothetical protein [Natrinema sp. SYSU A 869]|uniref:hypothetical protein n=1 Tax=Natrinema sp. SYSU A 869 TaxID=2871694 RepID=UPI001CA3C375|nr:hypothetical protein [Natrinema sp. SYSU A 869]